MRVNKARQILSTQVSSSLKFLADHNGNEEYTTTAWFIEVVSKWFSLITSRNPQIALGNNGTQESYQNYNEGVQFLHAVIKLFQNLQIGFFKHTKSKKKKLITFPELNVPLSNVNDDIELNVLYYISGYILYSISKTSITCNKCLSSAGSISKVPNYTYAKLVKLRCYKANTLFFINDIVFQYFRDMENVIRSHLPYVSNVDLDLKSFFCFKIINVICTAIENCHNLSSKIMDRFIMFCMKMCNKKDSNNENYYSSKSMAMHLGVK
ncbi:hypothetical protein X777_13138 [Ooceraea biroi]|uniref:Transposable element P transposase-like GTP-binding insertion domain-containing protein n=1 Tax=Ooceraea biroi TaxID=2015173 RepID=A0A026VYI8_OOCBI|nr:hypothetical protein X777_13138 [Ooceraea biroi]